MWPTVDDLGWFEHLLKQGNTSRCNENHERPHYIDLRVVLYTVPLETSGPTRYWHKKRGHGECVEWVEVDNGWELKKKKP